MEAPLKVSISAPDSDVGKLLSRRVGVEGDAAAVRGKGHAGGAHEPHLQRMHVAGLWLCNPNTVI